ncbi:hypothetical protein AgCh_001454 [Apium graveolens]
MVFTVKRRSPELICPAKPTPHEYKLLSDIDDQEGLRVPTPPILQFYRMKNDVLNMDPVKVIRDALSKTLVFYYPLAGRLREGAGRKLGVECTGEGVMFVEADADVTLNQFGDTDTLQPPFPCFEEFLFDIPASTGVVDCPLLYIQVTRLRCGGFILASQINHTMCDATGLVQFLTAIGEIARGVSAPSVLPVWQRELLNARDPPRVTCTHPQFDEVADLININLDNIISRSFFFGPPEIRALRQLVPPEFGKYSSFDLLAACLWRCCIRSLQLDPEEEVRICILVNAREKFNPPLLPVGYYGNAFVSPTAVTTAGKLCQNSIGYGLKLVQKAKEDVTEEYIKSLADLMVLNGRPHYSIGARIFTVLDVRHAGFQEVDYGWGRPAYGGPVRGHVMVNSFVSVENKKGENGILVPIYLPSRAMECFAVELGSMLKNNDQLLIDDNLHLIKSTL